MSDQKNQDKPVGNVIWASIAALVVLLAWPGPYVVVASAVAWIVVYKLTELPLFHRDEDD